MSDAKASASRLGPTHPRIQQRRAEVEDASSRRRRRRLGVLGGIGALVLLAGAATQSPLLDVDEVRVVGAVVTPADEFREVAAIELGSPILRLDTDSAVDRLEAMPEVVSATASSSWRGVVTIEVEERVPAARITATNGVAIVGADGLVIDLLTVTREPVDADAATGADAVTGEDTVTGAGAELDLGTAEFVLSDEIAALPELSGALFRTSVGAQIPTALDDALAVAVALPDDLAQVTERIEITVDSLVMRVVGGGQISLGDARDLDDKFGAVRAFLSQVDLRCLDTLNVRAPSVPVIERNDC